MEQNMRLAFREEGDRWNAYCAKMGTMEGAIWIGSIHVGAVKGSKTIKDAFMDLMKSVFATAIENLPGAQVTGWHEEAAPEHEKAGRA